MPLQHTRTFRVRYSDCDAYGHLNSANYLRLMQDTATDASTAIGYDQRRYEELRRVWLIRESQVEYLAPLHYDDRIEVVTWIGDFRRASSRRMYEFRRAGQSEVAARAYSDWVYLDTETNRPVPIPREVAEDFDPGCSGREYPVREPYPTPPPPPAGAYRMRRQVEWLDIDSMQHVNNASYMDFSGECGFQAIKHFGWPWQRMVQEGFAIFIRRAWLQYLQPALPEDELEISTWIYNVRRATAERHYTICRVSDGTLLAQVNTTGAWVNLKDNRPMRIPDEMRRDFAAHAAESVG